MFREICFWKILMLKEILILFNLCIFIEADNHKVLWFSTIIPNRGAANKWICLDSQRSLC